MEQTWQRPLQRPDAKLAKNAKNGMDRFDDEIERLAYEVIGAAIEVHRHMGMGHPESAYANALALEFDLRGIPYEREYHYALAYKGETVGEGRLDFFVGKRLTVELKAVEAISDAHRGRTTNYLCAVKEPLGLLINFNVLMLKDKGIFRIVQSVFRK